MYKIDNDIKICVACSAGGHFQELMEVIPENIANLYLVTFQSNIDKNTYPQFKKIYFVDDASKLGWRLISCALKSFYIYVRERPSVIISSGAGVSVPTLIYGWLFKCGILYLELSCQIEKPSKTGKFAYKIATRFYIQHASLIPYYPKAILFARYEQD